MFPEGSRYEVLNFKEDFIGSLKVVLKIEAYGNMHCDDLNLYAYRSRESFIKQAEYVTGVPSVQGAEEITAIIRQLEEIRNRRLITGTDEPVEEKLTEAEIARGMAFLTNPDLIGELKDDLTAIGCVGEDNVKILLYLVATSRMRTNPIPAYVLGRSSGGKSWLVKTVLKLVPDDGKFIITKVSPEVIYYMEKGLMHKVVMVGEFDGAEDIEYLLRELVSDGYVSKLVTLKDPHTGLPRPEHVVSHGPISLISTSTRPEDLNPENLNRCILLSVDESPEQTERILRYQRFMSSREGYLAKLKADEIIRKHHVVQRLLEDLMVFNTFQEELDFPTLLLLARRAHFNFLHVIEMAAFVFQKQHTVCEMEAGGKIIRYIETDDRDYAIAHRLLMNGIMESTLDEMPAGSRELHAIMLAMAKEKAGEEGKSDDAAYLERREVVRHSGWSVKQVKTYIRILVEYGYLEIVSGRATGQRHKYRVLDVKSRITELLSKIPTPEEMKKRRALKKKS
jgi:hypothetical protein